jgi:hypothetical protein
MIMFKVPESKREVYQAKCEGEDCESTIFEIYVRRSLLLGGQVVAKCGSCEREEVIA